MPAPLGRPLRAPFGGKGAWNPVGRARPPSEEGGGEDCKSTWRQVAPAGRPKVARSQRRTPSKRRACARHAPPMPRGPRGIVPSRREGPLPLKGRVRASARHAARGGPGGAKEVLQKKMY